MSLDLWLAEGFLDDLLQSARRSAALDERFEVRLGGEWTGAGLRTRLSRLRLRLRRADRGCLRLELGLRAEARFGLPGADSWVEVSGALLVWPELERDEAGGFVLGTRFATAELVDLRIREPWSRLRRSLDPFGLDRFSEDRLGELLQPVARQLLERLGERELRIGGRLVERLAAAVDGPIALFVGDGYARVEGGTGEAPVPAGPACRPAPSGTPPEPRSTKEGAPVAMRLELGESVLKRLVEDQRLPASWRIDALRLTVDASAVEVAGRVYPAHPRWPVGLAANVLLRLRPMLHCDGIGLLIDDLALDGPAPVVWAEPLLRRLLWRRLSSRRWPAEHRLRPPYGRLRIRDLRLEPGFVAVLCSAESESGGD